ANDPGDRACRPFRGRQLAAARLNALDRSRALPPEATGEVGPVLPESVADHVRVPGPVLPVILYRVGVTPAPGDRLAGPQHHIHRGAGSAVAVPFGFAFEDVNGGLPLVVRPLVGVQYSLSVGALDQVVVAHEVLLTGDGPVVPQQVHRVHVAVKQVPAAVEEGLRNA